MKRPNIDQIRERTEKASPGPWKAEFNGNNGYEIECPMPEMNCVEFTTKADYQPMFIMAYAPWMQFSPKVWEETQKSNHIFIAHARQDIPDLLQYITEIEGELVRNHEEVNQILNRVWLECEDDRLQVWLEKQMAKFALSQPNENKI